ncbi:MAG: hypothetical protein R3F43_32380 [bacterium]
MQRLLGDGWEQVCNAFYGPPALCATGDPTGDGPFQLFNAPGPTTPSTAASAARPPP